MQIEQGKLVRWHDDKGFGFIKPQHSDSQDVFIHISALKHMARKPVIGDVISYQITQQADGKSRACNANIVGVARRQTKPGRRRHTPQRSPILRWLPMLLILALIVIGMDRPLNKPEPEPQIPVSQQFHNSADTSSNLPAFRCETGKQHCSQMRSCEEAMFYIKHCPNTKMDGDKDGIPCERQWCN
ncbi:excalibur calcium-binding domain-containing protein [Shewanella sp. Scap07]|uniref:excalibur calcium-binding domain-containing protein n=1 Tax=Shewanella sp. Scap07 TaxID=2589987 RepID=UPI00277B577F|nr:excalibur calcium-binding domain-containing protein [Shewanella sp. Scap07]